jgi:hypothetical protein
MRLDKWAWSRENRVFGRDGQFRFRRVCFSQSFSGAAEWRGYHWSMSKSQDKKRTEKTNKAKLTPKEKKLKRVAKKIAKKGK